MKRMLYNCIPVLALVITVASCKKDDTATTPTTPTTPTPTQGPTPATPMPSGPNLSGALISVQMKYTTQPVGSPLPVDLNSEMGIAVFYTSPGATTRVDAGAITVNNNALAKQTDNSYLKWAYIGGTPADLGFATTSNWSVGGSSNVTAFTYDDNAPFPDYTGDVPTSVTKANGVTLTLNSSTLSNADSVYIVIASGSQSFTKGYSAKAGSVNITANDLQNLATSSTNTAVFEICPFKYREVVKNGKNYFAIKEQAIVRNININ